MSEDTTQEVVSKKLLVISILITIILTAIIVGSVVFAWQNSRITKDNLFRQDLLNVEGQSLENQLDIVTKNAQTEPAQE